MCILCKNAHPGVGQNKLVFMIIRGMEETKRAKEREEGNNRKSKEGKEEEMWEKELDKEE